jgi:hypothetical protein
LTRQTAHTYTTNCFLQKDELHKLVSLVSKKHVGINRGVLFVRPLNRLQVYSPNKNKNTGYIARSMAKDRGVVDVRTCRRDTKIDE